MWKRIFLHRAGVLLIAIAVASLLRAESLTGLWDASIVVNGTAVPFKLEFSGEGAQVRGWFFNGPQHETSTSGSFADGTLVLNFASYASVLKLQLRDGSLDGEYTQRGKSLPVHATRTMDETASSGTAPDISGLWYLENVESSKKGERAWQFIVEQHGAQVSAAILRVDGDTGTLTGRYRNGQFVLSHFSGARPALVTAILQSDGTLKVELNGLHHEAGIVGMRPEQARARSLPDPVDASAHTGVQDPSQPFAFRFPDLNGNLVSNTDDRFLDKVVLINITGSWCPNCHDEAPFLAALYGKYHAQGLEIVALSFEEAEQLTTAARLRALVQEYGIPYIVLLAGETSSAKEKLAQARDWDSWPTTFFVGRDGLVKAVHAGFPSPASGELYRKETAEFTAQTERLLAEHYSSRMKIDR